MSATVMQHLHVNENAQAQEAGGDEKMFWDYVLVQAKTAATLNTNFLSRNTIQETDVIKSAIKDDLKPEFLFRLTKKSICQELLLNTNHGSNHNGIGSKSTEDQTMANEEEERNRNERKKLYRSESKKIRNLKKQIRVDVKRKIEYFMNGKMTLHGKSERLQALMNEEQDITDDTQSKQQQMEEYMVAIIDEDSNDMQNNKSNEQTTEAVDDSDVAMMRSDAQHNNNAQQLPQPQPPQPQHQISHENDEMNNANDAQPKAFNTLQQCENQLLHQNKMLSEMDNDISVISHQIADEEEMHYQLMRDLKDIENRLRSTENVLISKNYNSNRTQKKAAETNESQSSDSEHASTSAVDANAGVNTNTNKPMISYLEKKLESLKRVLNVDRMCCTKSDGLVIETLIHSTIYKIQIQFYSNDLTRIQSICVKPQSLTDLNDNHNNMRNSNRNNDTASYVPYVKDIIDAYEHMNAVQHKKKDNSPMHNHEHGNGNGNGNGIENNFVLLTKQIMVRLNKLPLRYKDLDSLHEQFGDQSMIYERNLDEIIFVFSFDGNQDAKVDIRITLILSWDYPQQSIAFGDGDGYDDESQSPAMLTDIQPQGKENIGIATQHQTNMVSATTVATGATAMQMIFIDQYNIHINSSSIATENKKLLENQWNAFLIQVMKDVQSKHQNSICQFVNHIHQQLQAFYQTFQN